MSAKDLKVCTRSRRGALALVLLAAAGLLAATAMVVPGAARAAAAYDLRGTWDTYGTGGGYSGTFTVSTMDLSTGAFSGTGDGGMFALKGTETGSSVVFTQSEGGYVSTDRATLKRSSGKLEMVNGTWRDSNGSGGTFTAAITSPSGSTGSTGAMTPPGTFTFCVPSDCSALSLAFPEPLSAQSPITLTVDCGASATRRLGGPVAVAAQGSTCQQPSFLANMASMVNIDYEQQTSASEGVYGRAGLAEIKKALMDLGTTDQSPTVKSAANQLLSDPTLTPDAHTTSEVQSLLQALSQEAQSDPTDPGLALADGSLSATFTDASASSASLGVRSASAPQLHAPAALAALIAHRPNGADGTAFAQAIALASAHRSSGTRGAARLTLVFGVLLALHLPGHASHAHAGALIARAATHPSAHGKKTVLVHPTLEGGRTLRELEVIGLAQPTYVSVRLSERTGKGATHRASRSIRVI